MDDVYTKPGYLFRRMQQIAVSIFMEECREFDLTPVQYAALVAIRTLTFVPGASTSMNVADSGYLYRVTLNVTGKEAVQTGLGTVPAWKVVPAIRDAKGQAVGRGMAVWISDDARRLPLKMQAQLPVGSFVFTLREAK